MLDASSSEDTYFSTKLDIINFFLFVLQGWNIVEYCWNSMSVYEEFTLKSLRPYSHTSQVKRRDIHILTVNSDIWSNRNLILLKHNTLRKQLHGTWICIPFGEPIVWWGKKWSHDWFILYTMIVLSILLSIFFLQSPNIQLYCRFSSVKKPHGKSLPIPIPSNN